jgi:CHASE2 domain-containing sensor protein
VIVVSAVSAGIHAALTPEHFREGAGPGGGFLLATLLLAGLAVALTRRPGQSRLPLAAAATLAGLIGSYALAITTGLPLIHPEVEPVDGLALATKAIEAVGLLASLRLLRRGPNPAITYSLQPKGTVT